MSRPLPRSLSLLLALAGAVAVAGCGRGGALPTGSSAGGSGAPATVAAPPITKNTARLGGASPIDDAAAVATAVYPGLTPETHPQAVVLADSRDWASAIAASVLMSTPLGAPLLYSNGPSLPAQTAAALKQLAPTGARSLGGAQVIRIGDVAMPSGLRSTSVAAATPAAFAAAILRLSDSVHPQSQNSVLLAPERDPQYAMPAAGYAAVSGVPILYVDPDSVPTATLGALRTMTHPHMYILGPGTIIDQSVVRVLRRFGTVKRIRGTDPASNAVALASYDDNGFGWDVVQPGHGLVFLNATRPLDAAAAAPLSASGDFGPQLVLLGSQQLPPVVHNYLLNIQPGYEPGTPGHGPVDESYNHGWIIGDQSAVTYLLQAQIDQLLEIVPISQSSIAAASATVSP